MALRGVLTHRKTRKLARLLGIDPCCAMGILEALWHVTASQFPTGAIGRMGDDEIADQMFSTRDPAVLIGALKEAEWLDEHPRHRLIVHDWHIHSDNTLDAQLMRRGERYANGAIPRGSKIGKTSTSGRQSEFDDLIERFYRSPAPGLFQQDQVIAAGERQDRIREQEAAPNVLHFTPAPDGAARSLPVPEPEPVPVPEPAPDSVEPHRSEEMWIAGEKEQRARSQDRSVLARKALDTASRHVVKACGWYGTTAARLQSVVWMALDAECGRRHAPPAEIAQRTAERMVRNYAEWTRAGPLVEYPRAPSKFFEEGHWQGDATWRYDQAALRTMRLRSQACAGMAV